MPEKNDLKKIDYFKFILLEQANIKLSSLLRRSMLTDQVRNLEKRRFIAVYDLSDIFIIM